MPAFGILTQIIIAIHCNKCLCTYHHYLSTFIGSSTIFITLIRKLVVYKDWQKHSSLLLLLLLALSPSNEIWVFQIISEYRSTGNFFTTCRNRNQFTKLKWLHHIANITLNQIKFELIHRIHFTLRKIRKHSDEVVIYRQCTQSAMSKDKSEDVK